jgi:sirohydrochlorin ferrochelatase
VTAPRYRRLVTVAHGTRQAQGNEVARELTAAASERLGVPAIASYVELSAPLFADVLAESVVPTVVVPLLLSTGYHVREDLPTAVAAAHWPVSMVGPLGPDPLLARAQAHRLLQAGARPGEPVVLVAAGSRDPAAADDLDRAASLLAGVWGGSVRVATLSGSGPRPAELVGPDTAVSPYLLAPGHFADRAVAESRASGASVVAGVIGPHPLVVDLVVERAAALLRERLVA